MNTTQAKAVLEIVKRTGLNDFMATELYMVKDFRDFKVAGVFNYPEGPEFVVISQGENGRWETKAELMYEGDTAKNMADDLGLYLL